MRRRREKRVRREKMRLPENEMEAIEQRPGGAGAVVVVAE